MKKAEKMFNRKAIEQRNGVYVSNEQAAMEISRMSD
jgi:hypothetical protein